MYIFLLAFADSQREITLLGHVASREDIMPHATHACIYCYGMAACSTKNQAF